MTDRDEFFHVMGANGVPVKVVAEILRLATVVQRHMEIGCNRDTTAREDKRCKFALDAISAHARVNGLTVQFQDDPRGACVKLKLPGGQHNDFAGEGLWCVPAQGYTAKQMERIAP